jgi:Polyketide cyclase / dehydrase and lipid transport
LRLIATCSAVLFSVGTQVALSAPAVNQPPVTAKASKSDEKISVEARFTVRAPIKAVWAVLTDFDHMTSFLPNFEFSKIVERDGDRWQVTQKGKQSFGLISIPFDNLRQVILTPYTRIESHLIRGSLKQSDGLTMLIDKGDVTDVVYHGEFVPTVSFPSGLAIPAVESETRKQFEQIRGEVDRRTEKGE